MGNLHELRFSAAAAARRAARPLSTLFETPAPLTPGVITAVHARTLIPLASQMTACTSHGRVLLFLAALRILVWDEWP